MDASLPSTLHDAMSTRLGDGWLTGEGRRLYGGDDSRRWAMPAAVALPRTREDVMALVRACREHRVPLVARGAGTGTTGAAVPTQGGVVVSFARMDRILELRAADRCVVVEPGVLNGGLQQTLAPYGLFWPPDPSSADLCSVGGNLATNAGGPRAVKYGTARDNVLGLVAVTGTGELIRCGGAYTKDATGYDLTHLFVGSEGTLALIVEATLKLAPRPRAQAGLRVLYRDAASAAAAVSRIMARPATPTMLEFMDHSAIALIRRHGSDVPEAGAMLLIEADGEAETLPATVRAIEAAASGTGLVELRSAGSAEEAETLWACRKALSPSLRKLAPKKVNEDVAVPVTQLPALIAGVQALSREHGLPIVCFGHAGNGNIHVNLLANPDDPAQMGRIEACLAALFRLVLSLRGTLSGEHGVGIDKRDYVGWEVDADTLEQMRAVKRLFDPLGILNPGKALPATLA